MQEFFILKGSLNPVLEMELINDGRYDFQKSLLNDALQDSVVTFNMKDEETVMFCNTNGTREMFLKKVSIKVGLKLHLMETSHQRELNIQQEI